jgi:hypothetical protein
MNLHEQHRPAEIGGSGSYPVWRLSKCNLDPDLLYQETSRTHGRLAPARRMSLQDYEAALARTRASWTRVVG